jgi:hypothetical protein
MTPPATRSASRYSMRSAAAFAERMRDRTVWYSGLAWGRARIAARAALASAGLPIRKEYLVLGCAPGEDASGLFSEVSAVIGGLAHYEAMPEIYAGLRVDFEDEGLYYEPAAGLNWWEYYFEPLRIGRPDAAVERSVAVWQHDAFAETVEHMMSRENAATLLARHVRVKAHLKEQVDRYWVDHVNEVHTIGIHYRGTDKVEEAPMVAYESVSDVVRQALQRAGSSRSQIFVATDEQPFLDYILGRFPGQVLHRDIPRSVDGRPTHKQPGDGFRKGADAVTDCLLLSRCAELVRTDSNLGLVATFFNPELPVRLVGASS